jgi:hypothetical protein
MKQNTLLFISGIIWKVAMVLGCILAFAISVVMILYIVNPELPDPSILIPLLGGMKMNFFPDNTTPSPAVTLMSLEKSVVIYSLAISLSQVIMILIILRQLQRFTQSFRDLTTFFDGNIKVFRSIAWCFLALFFLNLLPHPVIMIQPGAPGFTKITWDFDLLFFALFLLSLMFSEVFREGARLKNENDLTI